MVTVTIQNHRESLNRAFAKYNGGNDELWLEKMTQGRAGDATAGLWRISWRLPRKRERGFQGKVTNWMLRQEGGRKPRRLGILCSQEPGHRGNDNGRTYWNLGLNQMGGPSATMGTSCVPMTPGSTRRFMSTGMTGFEYFKPNNGQIGILGFAGHVVSVTSTQLCYESKSSYMQ